MCGFFWQRRSFKISEFGIDLRSGTMTERPTAEQLLPGTHDLFEAKIGEELVTIEFVITEEMVERNAWATDDYNPWYMDNSPFGGRIISPAYLASFDANVLFGYYAYPPGGSLYAKEEFEYIQPVMVGSKYTMRGKMLDIYKRRGRTFFVCGIVVADMVGTDVVRIVKTVAAPVRPLSAG
jgi:acyl dehydratase